MILTAIILNIFNVVILLVKIILIPINSLLITLVPSLDTAFESIYSLLSMVSNTFSYTVSLTMLSQTALQIIVLYYTFILTLPFLVYIPKLTIKWFHKLKP